MSASRRSFLAMLCAAGFPTCGSTPKKEMLVRSVRPEDFEMPLDGFESWLTPVERFFVRSHHYTPQVDASAWRLDIGGLVDKPLTFTLDELRKLPRAQLTAVLECAGNGRGLYEPSVTGLQWKYGAVGNARWAGVRLGDLLQRAGIRNSAVEVLFDGADIPVGKMPEFRRSIPIRKALSPDTLLAYEMNGEPLPVSHGFPLRLIVPGWAGDSWTKWVVRIDVLDREYDGFFMKTAYRHPGHAVVPGAPIDPAAMHPVTSLRVKSVIAKPLQGSRLAPGVVRISGAAWSGDGRAVNAVEVSTDTGRTWRSARFGPDRSQYGWRLWEIDWTPPRPAYYTIMARALDAGGDQQPFAQEWNPSGYLWNAVHQVGVEISASGAREEAPRRDSELSKPELPDNFKQSCLSCHEIDVIEQQRLTREQWDREIDKMVRWGAPVRPQDRPAFAEFLVRHFGPQKQ